MIQFPVGLWSVCEQKCNLRYRFRNKSSLFGRYVILLHLWFFSCYKENCQFLLQIRNYTTLSLAQCISSYIQFHHYFLCRSVFVLPRASARVTSGNQWLSMFHGWSPAAPPLNCGLTRSSSTSCEHRRQMMHLSFVTMTPTTCRNSSNKQTYYT